MSGMWKFTNVQGEIDDMGIVFPKVIVKKAVYGRLRKHTYATGFQYETGGVLLGYKCLRMIFITDFTVPRHLNCMGEMTFILDGKEHTREMERIRKRYLFPPGLVGVWHSHTTQDRTLSFQDGKANKMLANRFGDMISMIVTTKGANDIQMTLYYVSKRRTTSIEAVRYFDKRCTIQGKVSRK